MNVQIACMLCKAIGSKFKDINSKCSPDSNLRLKTVLESALNRKVKFEYNFYICVDCAYLLNNLNSAENTFRTIKKTILNYYGLQDVGNNMVNASTQTDLSGSLKISDEFVAEMFEIGYVDEFKSNYNKSNILHDGLQQEFNVIKDEAQITEETVYVKDEMEKDVILDDVHLGDCNTDEPKHNSKIPRPYYKCESCSRVWRIKKNLRKHIINYHVNAQPFICEICGASFKRVNELNIHIRRHNGVLPFTCDFCKKSFVRRGALEQHLPIHTGETRYQCDTCGKRFIHHSSFRVHKLLHLGQKTYKCCECGLSLFSKSHLDRHMRVHTGEKNYKCQFCNRAFAERYNLMSHQKIHQNVSISEAKT